MKVRVMIDYNSVKHAAARDNNKRCPRKYAHFFHVRNAPGARIPVVIVVRSNKEDASELLSTGVLRYIHEKDGKLYFVINESPVRTVEAIIYRTPTDDRGDRWGLGVRVLDEAVVPVFFAVILQPQWQPIIKLSKSTRRQS